MSFFALKIVAVLSMFFDHFYALFGQNLIEAPLAELTDRLCAAYPGDAPFLSLLLYRLPSLLFPYLGRLAAPIFMFCIANGYRHTHDVRRYAARIFLFGLIAQLPYALFFKAEIGLPLLECEPNFLFTLGLGLLSICGWDRPLLPRAWRGPGAAGRLVVCRLLCAALPLLAAELFHTEGGGRYALLVLLFHLTMDWGLPGGEGPLPGKRGLACKALVWLPVFPLARWRLVTWLFSEPAALHTVLINAAGPYLGVLVTLFYNGKKGRGNRAAQLFVYAFYPAHFLVLALCKFAVGP